MILAVFHSTSQSFVCYTNSCIAATMTACNHFLKVRGSKFRKIVLLISIIDVKMEPFCWLSNANRNWGIKSRSTLYQRVLLTSNQFKRNSCRMIDKLLDTWPSLFMLYGPQQLWQVAGQHRTLTDCRTVNLISQNIASCVLLIPQELFAY